MSLKLLKRQFYPQFETFLPLKSFLCQFYVAKRPFKSYKICSKIFEHWFDPPPLLKNVKKTTDLGDDATPYHLSFAQLYNV